MKTTRRQERQLRDRIARILPDYEDELVPVSLSLKVTKKECEKLVASILSESTSPFLSLETNDFRSGPDATSKETFRMALMKTLRPGWRDTATEARFIRLANILKQEGCAAFAGLVDAASFRHLVDDFSSLMNDAGTHAFLHSFANLIAYPRFINNPAYNDALIHPLLIAMMSYVMGGPVRMTDARGKDTPPLSVNAQDNMLHVDNTPFREEYKILLGWEKGEVKGPTGQNFTFLPGTHLGTRSIRTDKRSQPWSTENDSLFITEKSVDEVLSFQKDIIGCPPRVVEVEYPQQPITVLFNAGSLVHHRYRNNDGTTRSCVITAFHLASDHPGALIASSIDGQPKTLAGILMGHQSESNAGIFCSLLGSKALLIESKIQDILNETHHSTMIETTGMELSGEKLERWRETVIHAPSATQVKFKRGYYITLADRFISRKLLKSKLADAMAYDKHGLLDLIIYRDGHEEIRKPARKSVWTMPREGIMHVLTLWLPVVESHRFTTADVENPRVLQKEAYQIARLIRESFPSINFARESTAGKEQQLSSAQQLIVDLGESITRCEQLETYITTNLFLFLIINQTLPILDLTLRQEGIVACGIFLRAYIASVLLAESIENDAISVGAV
ncbi:hypothetical protein CGRA01v4_01973 [Colletotrichum graminicola]|uniref:Uncharacterized protein n=1 Tax=Colletotrichum graminicola (strain M1.001 / M2 / FGSC 10212) TaxID=645133 RepID=E3QJP3_COLGM|nr:uncharacterized protein GLRG_06225 [Colletotrichum graminicola M1.001]EFQ31081.1 hypothetical protein GLRG_06225 [Colletotrichum graminicola M1.001]WDK10694.1 hypothetical protein CGRA01v4_01973 [Colletotrichum graminicola]